MVDDKERGDGEGEEDADRAAETGNDEEEEEEEEGGAAGERGSVELLVTFRPEKEARP